MGDLAGSGLDGIPWIDACFAVVHTRGLAGSCRGDAGQSEDTCSRNRDVAAFAVAAGECRRMTAAGSLMRSCEADTVSDQSERSWMADAHRSDTQRRDGLVQNCQQMVLHCATAA